MSLSFLKRRPVAAALLVLGVAVGSCVDSTAPAVLTAPADVTVTLIGPHSARITWASVGPEVDYIEIYNVFRDGVKIGQTTQTTFTDSNLSEGVTYKYRVSAEGYGVVSELSSENGSSAITIPDITAPTVSSTVPGPNAAGIALSSTVSAVFSEPVDPNSVNTVTFFLKTSGGVVIPATVAYTAATRTALLTPASPLPNASTLSATITTGIKDVPGNKLAADFVFSFSTRDEGPPAVVSSSPINGASGVQVNAPITVTFSEAMDVATINATTVTLRLASSGVSVTGAVAYNPATFTATFTPAAALAFNTEYTVGVATGVTDASGNHLATAFVATFNTTTAPDATPPSVVSVSPLQGATGVSVNTSATILFSEPMSAATINSNNVVLRTNPGGAPIAASVVYNSATNTATLTPVSPLSFASGYAIVVTTEATDAAGNSFASQFQSLFSTEAAPDVTSPTVTSITPSTGSLGVSVNTSVTVAFSEQMDPGTITGSTISLVVAATSLPVPGTLSYSVVTNVATFTPASPLSFATGYAVSVTTGAKDLSGNTLAAGAASSFTTESAPDATRPTVVSVTPAHLESGVSASTKVTVEFSEAMNSATINATTIVLNVTGTAVNVDGVVSYNPATKVATFTPSSLAFSTSYTVKVNGVTDLAGNGLASPFASIFATGAAPDLTPPTVSSSSPIGGATGVSPTVTPTVTFSEAMKASTINGSTIALTVTSSGTPVAGNVGYDAGTNTATFTPTAQLNYSTSYTLSAKTGVQDLAGNSLALQFNASFTVMPSPDVTRPTVVATMPPARRNPPLENRSFVNVVFSEPMDPATITTSSIVVKTRPPDDNIVPVNGTVSYDAATNTATFTPNAPLGYVESGQGFYEVDVFTTATDLAGNPVAGNLASGDYRNLFRRLPYYQGTTAELDDTKPQIHLHVTFSQNGNTLGLPVECQPLPGSDCDLLPKNQAGVDAVGPLDDTAGGSIGLAATITALSGSISGSNITFTFTIANGRSFTFTGTMSNVDTMDGELSGATLSAPVAVRLARF